MLLQLCRRCVSGFCSRMQLRDSFACAGAVQVRSAVFESLVTDWLVHALHLPPHFLMSSDGGGVIQPTATEAVIVAVVAAKQRKCLQQGEVGSSAYAQAAGKLCVYFR